MTDAPERIWLPLAHAEDAANMPAQGLIEYTRADLAPSPDVVRGLVKALKDVIGMLDDPHGGEHVRDMRGATIIARAALAAYEKETRHD